MTRPTTAATWQPGSFGCHEAMHMASVLADMVGERLCEHPSISRNAAWLTKAEAALAALHDLYQAIGAEHMSAPLTMPPEQQP